MSNFNNIVDQIQELIKNQKIEWKSLWEITIWNKRFRNVEKNKQKEILKCFSVSSNDLNNIQQDQNGDIKLLSTKKNDQRFTSEQFCKNFNVDEVISIPEGGDANIKYTNGKFVNSLNLLCKSYDNKKVNLKFVYYYLVCNNFLIINQYKGSAIKHPQMDKILEIQIPIPPLDIQNKIVEILDNFSNYETELETELETRTKQYNYYLNKLLDFSNSSDVEWKSLWEITIWNKRFRNVEKNKQKEILKCFSVSSNDLNNIQQDQNGDIKLLSTKKNDQRFTSEQFCKNFNVDEVISIPEGGDANIKYTNGKFVNSLNLLCKSYDNKKVNLKFVYYYLVCNNFLIINQYKGSAIKHPQMDKILEIQIPIPPLETQNKIVEILDNFSSLVNDIKDGLPKEIQLRKKQYNYYLNKLLDFK